MVKVTGKSAVDTYIANLPSALAPVLRGAARAGAAVISDEAKRRSISKDVSAAIVTRTTKEPGRIVAKITVKPGWPRSVAIWLEYGTKPHFISVDDSQSGGRTAKRVNQIEKEGASLVINGKFVGRTVRHPGTNGEPFMRVALDARAADAVEAAQNFINAHAAKPGAASTANGDDE